MNVGRGTIDVIERARRVFGQIAKDELESVDQGLGLFLGLAAVPEG